MFFYFLLNLINSVELAYVYWVCSLGTTNPPKSPNDKIILSLLTKNYNDIKNNNFNYFNSVKIYYSII